MYKINEFVELKNGRKGLVCDKRIGNKVKQREGGVFVTVGLEYDVRPVIGFNRARWVEHGDVLRRTTPVSFQPLYHFKSFFTWLLQLDSRPAGI